MGKEVEKANPFWAFVILPITSLGAFVSGAISVNTFKDLMRNDGGLQGLEMLMTQDFAMSVVGAVLALASAMSTYLVTKEIVKIFVEAHRKGED